MGAIYAPWSIIIVPAKKFVTLLSLYFHKQLSETVLCVEQIGHKLKTHLLDTFAVKNRHMYTVSPFLWMLLEKHPLCHHMCKVTKETSGANKIMRNAIDSTSITFQWTSSSSRQSVFSTTTIAKKTEENGSQSRKSDYLVKIGRWTSELLLG